MAEQTLAIFTAVKLETTAIARALGSHAGTLWRFGYPASDFGFPIVARMVGIGARRLPTQPVGDVGCIILAGFGGALDPSLKVGDVVLDWPSEDCGRAPSGPFRLGKIHASSGIVGTGEQKSRLFAETGAAAVEMEGEAVRKWLAGTGDIPLIGLRAITDAADEALDPALLALVDTFGRPKPFALARFVARHPSRIASLRRLDAAARLAGRRLGEAVASLVRSDELKRLLASR
jgi:adenosylhomocysteine nucleosidase